MPYNDDSTTVQRWLRRSLTWGVAALVAVFLLVRCVQGDGEDAGPHGPAGRPIAVLAAEATRGDLPIFIDALGTVTPLNSVLVRPRVDGQLQSVKFSEGQMVKAGELLAEIDPRPFRVQLQQAQGQLAQNEALLRNARSDLERYRTLWDQDSIARQELDTQQALVQQYEGTLASDRGAIADAQLQLDYAQIRAPIAGRVGLRQVDAGNMVYASDTTGIVRITQEAPISVVFTIPEVQIVAVRKQWLSGRAMTVEAWDRQRGAKIAEGRLLTVDNQIDATTGTVKLRAEFANADGSLFPNQFVNVRMQIDTVQGAIIIPANAVQRGSQGTFVYTVNADSTVRLQAVTVGESAGERVVISTGVPAGTRVVIDGIDKLRDGARVEIVKPQQSPPGAIDTGTAADAPRKKAA